MQQAQTELDLSNEKHIIMIEKYKKNLNDVKNAHIKDKRQLEQLLKDSKEEYLKKLENVQCDIKVFILIVIDVFSWCLCLIIITYIILYNFR